MSGSKLVILFIAVVYLHYAAAERAAREATKPCDEAQHAEPELGSGEAAALSEKMKVTEYFYRGE